jgi:hypothetical protein
MADIHRTLADIRGQLVRPESPHELLEVTAIGRAELP